MRHWCPPRNQSKKGHRLGDSQFRLSARLVHSFMAVDAEGDQIRIVIPSPAGCAAACDGPAGFAWNHIVGISSHHAAIPAFSARRRVRDQHARLLRSNLLHEALAVVRAERPGVVRQAGI